MPEDGSERHLAQDVLQTFLDFYPALLAFFKRQFPKNRDRAEDLAQDTILAALNALSRHPPPIIEKPIPFLLSIAWKRRADELGKMYRARREEPLDDGPYGSLVRERAQEVRVIESERLKRISAALALLTTQERQVIVLRHHEGLSNEETALRMGLPPARVSGILYLAHKKLRTLVLTDESGGKGVPR